MSNTAFRILLVKEHGHPGIQVDYVDLPTCYLLDPTENSLYRFHQIELGADNIPVHVYLRTVVSIVDLRVKGKTKETSHDTPKESDCIVPSNSIVPFRPFKKPPKGFH